MLATLENTGTIGPLFLALLVPVLTGIVVLLVLGITLCFLLHGRRPN